MEDRFLRLGHWVNRHRRSVLLVWVVALVLGALGAVQLSSRLLGGSGAIAGSDSETVGRILEQEFDNPYGRFLSLVVHDPTLTIDDARYQEVLNEAVAVLVDLPLVRQVTTPLTRNDGRLRSSDGHTILILIGLKATSTRQEEEAVPAIRLALGAWKEKSLREHPQAEIALTGPSALIVDLNHANQQDARRAEVVALPLTFLLLVFAFGALVAAGVPLVIGVVGTAVALGLAFLLSFAGPLSNLVENVMTMTGLAIGIDYSLLFISRYRVEVRHLPHAEALAVSLSRAGPAVLYSGLTVMIGLAGLTLSPLLETRSLGLGGALVVAVCVLAATTLLPALVGVLGSRIDAPRWLSQRLIRPARTEGRWQRWAEGVMDHPVRALLLSGCVLALLAWPALFLKTGFPSGNWYPPSSESSRGLELLRGLGNDNLLYPLLVVVRTTDGGSVVDPHHLEALVHLAQRWKSDARVGEVLSPVTLRDDLGLVEYTALYADLEAALSALPEIGELFLSRDRTAALFQVIPASGVPYSSIQKLARDLAHESVPTLHLQVGGQPVYYNDIDRSVKDSSAVVVGFVVVVTLLVLFLAFRSCLLPIKAIVMNLLAVSAGYGVVVAVFQGGQIIDAIPVYVPLIIFCLMFGLSMDYEVFLLSRIQEFYHRDGDNRSATAQGLVATGRLITSAALVMVIVFGAFAWAEVIVIQMIGLGLAVTVLVDATLVRSVLVPALMRLFGRWNWYPGRGRGGGIKEKKNDPRQRHREVLNAKGP